MDPNLQRDNRQPTERAFLSRGRDANTGSAGNICDCREDLYIKRLELKQRLMRLIGRMKSGTQALFIGFLAGVLVMSVLACPLWMGSLSQCKMPCPKENSSQHCPLTICQLSSPYLAADVSAHAPLLRELAAEPIVSPIPLTSLGIIESVQQDDGAPPGPTRPLFLQTHSLLI